MTLNVLEKIWSQYLTKMPIVSIFMILTNL